MKKMTDLIRLDFIRVHARTIYNLSTFQFDFRVHIFTTFNNWIFEYIVSQEAADSGLLGYNPLHQDAASRCTV